VAGLRGGSQSTAAKEARGGTLFGVIAILNPEGTILRDQELLEVVGVARGTLPGQLVWGMTQQVFRRGAGFGSRGSMVGIPRGTAIFDDFFSLFFAGQ